MDEEARLHVLQRDRWVDYPRASQALAHLERLLSTPKRERMPCMVMHGESNIGKTLIVTKFQREHPPKFDTVAGVERRPVVAMQMPATPDQHRFYSALLFELGAPHSASASLSVLEDLARGLLRRIAPQMLIVDICVVLGDVELARRVPRASGDPLHITHSRRSHSTMSSRWRAILPAATGARASGNTCINT